MRTTFAMAAAASLALLLAGTALVAQQTAVSDETSSTGSAAPDTSAQPSSETAGSSRVRIVRLSQVKGAVQLDRQSGQGFESAFPNLPITEGARLQTGSGFAEVEFEDSSTVRLAPDSLVEFPQLELLPSGAKVSTVNVVKGTVYVTRANTKGDDFTMTFGHQKVFPMPSSHLRLQMEATDAKLAVMDGSVQVPEASGQTEVGKKKTLTFNLADQGSPTLAKNVTEDQNDAWDKISNDYQKQYARSSSFGSSPYSYGISDMNYYGSFLDAAGCGSMWRPYFVSAAWSPFSNGLWAWYPGAGYSWVSPYPWGWMPFHYGAWNYCPGMGWGWMPGGAWLGLGNAGLLAASQPGQPSLPIRPPVHRPVAGASTLIPVNLKPLAVSGLSSHNTFVFRNDSAGLGVPRGSLGALHQFSSGVEHHGLIAMPVYSVPLQSGRLGNGEANSTLRQADRNGLSSASGDRGYSAARESGSTGGAERGGMSGGGGGMSGGGEHGGGMSGGGSSAPAGGAAAGGGGGRH